MCTPANIGVIKSPGSQQHLDRFNRSCRDHDCVSTQVLTLVIPAGTVEPIKMLGLINHALDGGAHGRLLANTDKLGYQKRVTRSHLPLLAC